MSQLDYTIFRRNLVRIRGVLGISARELAEQCELRHSKRIADIEDGRGKLTLEEVCAICKVIGYDIDSMLYREAEAKVNFTSTR